MGNASLIIIVGLMFLMVLQMLFLASRYKRVPAGMLLVVFGKTVSGMQEVHSRGGVFVWPIIQDYDYLDLKPFTNEIEGNFSSKDKVNVPIKSKVIFGISSKDGVKINASERLLGTDQSDIGEIGLSIIKGVLSVTIEQIDIVSLATSQKKVTEAVAKMINKKLNLVGLELIDISLFFPKETNSIIEELEQKFLEKKATSFEVGDKKESEELLKLLNQKIETNTKERIALIEEKLSLLVKYKEDLFL